MFKFVGAAIGISIASILPGEIAAEPTVPELVAQASPAETNRARTSFFCNAGPTEGSTPETSLSVSRGGETETAAILVWPTPYFSERAVALDLCQASAQRLQELDERQSIATSIFMAERVGEAIQICLQPEAIESGCTSDTVVFTAALPAVDPNAVLFDMIPNAQRSPRLRGDFPTVHPAFPFSFFRFGF